jgi:hypothetical protein
MSKFDSVRSDGRPVPAHPGEARLWGVYQATHLLKVSMCHAVTQRRKPATGMIEEPMRRVATKARAAQSRMSTCVPSFPENEGHVAAKKRAIGTHTVHAPESGLATMAGHRCTSGGRCAGRTGGGRHPGIGISRNALPTGAVRRADRRTGETSGHTVACFWHVVLAGSCRCHAGAVSNEDQVTDQIRDEIRRLRAGRGVFAPNLAVRMGPHLRNLCGMPDDGAHDDTAQLRPTLIQHLLALAGGLTNERQDALAISLAIDSNVEHLTNFNDRVDHLSTLLAASSRTALRRIGEAEHELAKEIAFELSSNTGGERFVKSYYIRSCRAIVDNTAAHADPATVVVSQEREIVCVQDGLAEIPIRFELPEHPDTPQQVFSARAQHGGRITAQRRLSPTGFELVLGLPSPLAQRKAHRFGISFTFPAELIRAHHVITGEVTIRHYQLIVKFHPDHPPAWIRRVDGEDIRTLDAYARRTVAPSGGFPLDAVGEANLTFHHLSPHLAYGCQYRWSGTPEVLDQRGVGDPPDGLGHPRH